MAIGYTYWDARHISLFVPWHARLQRRRRHAVAGLHVLWRGVWPVYLMRMSDVMLQACEREESLEEQIRALTTRLTEVRRFRYVLLDNNSMFAALKLVLSLVLLTDEIPTQSITENSRHRQTERILSAATLVGTAVADCDLWLQVEARASETERSASKLQREVDRLEGRFQHMFTSDTPQRIPCEHTLTALNVATEMV